MEDITTQNKAFQEENQHIHTQMKAYFALVEIAQKLHWPENYQDDLYVHDFNYLAQENAPVSFGWIIRANGTHIIDPRDHTPGAWNPLGLYHNFSGHTYQEADCRFYWVSDAVPQELNLIDFCQRFQLERWLHQK